jgi:hypothetical protein
MQVPGAQLSTAFGRVHAIAQPPQSLTVVSEASHPVDASASQSS